MVRSRLSKARHQYFSFIREEGAIYIKEYLEERRKQGEELSYDSPLLQFDVRGIKKNDFLRTTLVIRDVRDAIYGAGLRMRSMIPALISCQSILIALYDRVRKFGIFLMPTRSMSSGWLLKNLHEDLYEMV